MKESDLTIDYLFEHSYFKNPREIFIQIQERNNKYNFYNKNIGFVPPKEIMKVTVCFDVPFDFDEYQKIIINEHSGWNFDMVPLNISGYCLKSWYINKINEERTEAQIFFKVVSIIHDSKQSNITTEELLKKHSKGII